MPELPEVETTKRGITPLLVNRVITKAIVHQPQLRLSIPDEFTANIQHLKILSVTRRSKYLLIQLESGTIMIHLGMSGHLRVDSPDKELRRHDHIEIILDNKQILRYYDPRRFGLCVYTKEAPETHYLLSKLGPEPFDTQFSSAYLVRKAQGKKQPVKTFIMNNQHVVGVGNIYASESLFLSRIHPQTPAGLLSEKDFKQLIHNIREVLQSAIAAGGTTLKDFYSTDGQPGYFAVHLKVYGREHLSCFDCSTPIKNIKISGRQSAYCPNCQPSLF